MDRCQEGFEEASAQLRQAQNESSAQEGTLTGARAQLTQQERHLTDSRRKLQQGLAAAFGQASPCSSALPAGIGRAWETMLMDARSP